MTTDNILAVSPGVIEVEVIAHPDAPAAGTPSAIAMDLQVRRVLEVVPVSRSLAAVIAVLAFSTGRRS